MSTIPAALFSPFFLSQDLPGNRNFPHLFLYPPWAARTRQFCNTCCCLSNLPTPSPSPDHSHSIFGTFSSIFGTFSSIFGTFSTRAVDVRLGFWHGHCRCCPLLSWVNFPSPEGLQHLSWERPKHLVYSLPSLAKLNRDKLLLIHVNFEWKMWERGHQSDWDIPNTAEGRAGLISLSKG